MNETHARLMRAIAAELLQLKGEVASPATVEKIEYAKMVLDYLAADLDVAPAVAQNKLPALRGAIEEALRLPAASAHRLAYAGIARLPDAAEVEIAALRSLAAQLMRDLSQRSDEAAKRACEALAKADFRWLRAFDGKQATRAALKSPAMQRAPEASGLPTTASLTSYLRKHFAQEKSLAVNAVTLMPGGRSKRTMFLTLEGGASLPPALIMRQDLALKHAGTTVCDEYGPLAKLAALGLPVPKPLHLERDKTELGPAFMLVERVAGGPPGDYFGLAQSCPAAYLDLARTLGMLHKADPASLGAPRGGGAGGIRAYVEDAQAKWRHYALTPSPLIDYAFFWALRESRKVEATPVLVHGDCGPHNLMVEKGRLTALLDWEFMHLGDPAEDLGIARVYCETILPWADFMAAYSKAGGPPVSDTRVRLGMLLNYLKGCVLVARSGRNFAEGGTDEFMKGANSYTGLRKIEMKIAALLEDKLAR